MQVDWERHGSVDKVVLYDNSSFILSIVDCDKDVLNFRRFG